MAKKATILVNAGRNSAAQQGAVNPPIYQTSTVIFPSLKEYHEAEKGISRYKDTEGATLSDPSYGIGGTSTTFALQKALMEMEGGAGCVITSSGLAAITLALMSFTQAGDHILVTDSVYGPTRRFCHLMLKKYGVEVTFYDPLIGKNIGSLVRKNTTLIFMESPGSLTFEVQDVPAIVKVAQSKGIVTVTDNSWASPLFFNPLQHGADVTIQALTKYIGGHADMILGAVVVNKKHADKIIRTYRNLGITASPKDCYMALRGLRTLEVRMKRQQEAALEIAQKVAKNPKVSRVLYPALPGDPGHTIWKRDFSGAGSLFSAVLKRAYSMEELAHMIDNLEWFSIGCSWGGYESLALDFNPSAKRTAVPWKAEGSCLRFYIGLEDTEDLLADLEQGFKRLPK